MLVVSKQDKALCSDRANTVDHDRVAALHYLGNYTRTLPVSMARMMENARDWEHLPHIHASSFAAIEAIDQGHWGWRAKVAQPGEGAEDQLLELVIDYEQNYWATAILAGAAQGVEVHTRATEIAAQEIEIDVRFYNATELPEEMSAIYLEVLQGQYATLYDEDVPLMSGRQQALDDQRQRRDSNAGSADILVGEIEKLPRNAATVVDTPTGRYCVRYRDGQWLAHSAVCTHQLGPLDRSLLASDGSVTCPWHGYRFDIASGENLDGKCASLATAPQLEERSGKLYLLSA